MTDEERNVAEMLALKMVLDGHPLQPEHTEALIWMLEDRQMRLEVFTVREPPTHVQRLTVFDRDDNPIPPTCAHCGARREYCTGTPA